MKCLRAMNIIRTFSVQKLKKRAFLKLQTSTSKLICKWLKVLKVSFINFFSSNTSKVEQKSLLSDFRPQISSEAERVRRGGGHISKVADNYVRHCYIWRIRQRSHESAPSAKTVLLVKPACTAYRPEKWEEWGDSRSLDVFCSTLTFWRLLLLPVLQQFRGGETSTIYPGRFPSNEILLARPSAPMLRISLFSDFSFPTLLR